MSRLIDADKLLGLFIESGQKHGSEHGCKLGENWLLDYNDIKAVIDNAPTIEPKKGKWIPEKMNDKHNIGCLDKKVDIMEEDAKQASIPYSMPKDYIKNRLDYER